MYCGFNNDNHRSGVDWQPMQDRPGVASSDTFGSAHFGGFNIVFCDGSVHTIPYTIDLETHKRLSNREDGQSVDSSAF